MNILLVHQDFPGQFKYLTGGLVRRGHNVIALGLNDKGLKDYQGAEVIIYGVSRASSAQIHPWAQDHESKMIRAEGCYAAALKLKKNGFTPDVIVAHLGWGEPIFLKEAWPSAKLIGYGELYYNPRGQDIGFDTENYPENHSTTSRIIAKNSSLLLGLQMSDLVLCPTKWQAQTFPEEYQSKIRIIHEGVDTRAVSPNSNISVRFANGLELSRRDEIITFVNRNLEPYRGFHVFMRAITEIMHRRPAARILIVGADSIGYGGPHSSGRTWKDVMLEEITPSLAPGVLNRIHFLGPVAYESYVAILQLSSVHVYLTYPYILGWSLIEAMSAECAIVASTTAPVQEVLEHDITARLVDFFDSEAVASETIRLLENAELRERLGKAARQKVLENFDLENVSMPALVKLVEEIAVR